MAVRTGLEPATFRVTGGRSNQLNYRTKRYIDNRMEPAARFELATHRLQGGSSTAELSWHQRPQKVILIIQYLFLLFFLVSSLELLE